MILNMQQKAAIFIILLHSLLVDQGRCLYVKPIRNLTCAVCEHKQDNIDECPTGDKFEMDPGQVVDKCSSCYIRLVWRNASVVDKVEKSRGCLITNEFTDQKCTYFYPLSKKDHVFHTCRCSNKDNCNIGTIEDLGGHSNPKDFPPTTTDKPDDSDAYSWTINSRLFTGLVIMMILDFAYSY